MYNITTEQIVKTKAPMKANVFKVIMIAACVLAVTTIPSTYAIGVILFAILVVFTVLLFKYYNAEYEYSFVDGELTIDKIMARSMRKRCGIYNISKSALVAVAGSQEDMRMGHKKLRAFDYTANDGSNGVVVVYTYDNNNEMVKLILQPDDKMLEAFEMCTRKDTFKIPKSV